MNNTDSKSFDFSNLHDVIIVGAGQYGLGLARELKKKNLDFAVLESHARVGESWRNRYDSLLLFTPNRYNNLPDLLFPGSPEQYPTKDEVAKYLESYKEEFDLPVLLAARVSRIERRDGLFYVSSTRGAHKARSVVLAIGAFQKPFIPPVTNDRSIQELHSSAYRNPNSISGKKVLVVGGGNSATQIAEELAVAREVTVAARSRPRCIPHKILGFHFLWWFWVLGILDSRPKDKKTNPLIGCTFLKKIDDGQIIFRETEVHEIKNGEVVFADNSREKFDAIVWATGFVRDISWIPKEVREAPGFFSIGEHESIRVSSGLLIGVAKDARDVARQIMTFLRA